MTNVYVDGFNLYKGIESHINRLEYQGQPTPLHWKWLNLEVLAERLAPRDSINRVRYFTARVTSPRGDPQSAQRQETYLRALETLPRVSTHFGNFKSGRKRVPLYEPPGAIREFALRILGFHPKRYPDGNVSLPMLKTEEKGSDVKLATYLMLDAYRAPTPDFEKAIVISNDTDLCEPVRLVVEQLGLHVTVVTPRGHQPVARDLKRVASTTRGLRMKAVVDSQLPEVLTDQRGTITRPAKW